MIAALLAVLLAPPEFDARTHGPLDLGRLPVADARRLNGREVWVLVTAETPPWTHSGRAIIGFAPDDDGTERTASLDGSAEDHDLREGDRLSVVGRLDVIDHKPVVINGVRFPGFTEVRVTGRLGTW